MDTANILKSRSLNSWQLLKTSKGASIFGSFYLIRTTVHMHERVWAQFSFFYVASFREDNTYFRQSYTSWKISIIYLCLTYLAQKKSCKMGGRHTNPFQCQIYRWPLRISSAWSQKNQLTPKICPICSKLAVFSLISLFLMVAISLSK